MGDSKSQNLRNFPVDKDGKRNLAIFDGVKKGDILLVPKINRLDSVVIVKALHDWNSLEGYKFEIPEKHGDYGHCFSAEKVGEFVRNNEQVSGGIRSTLRTPMRFWNINYLKDDIDKLIDAKNLMLGTSIPDQVKGAMIAALEESQVEDLLFNNFTHNFQASEWEYALTEIYQQMYPNYIVERTGGATEKDHGTDILIKIPGITEEINYAIAIQVKDYTGSVSQSVVDQINKADAYFQQNNNGDEQVKLIDKYIVVTNTSKELNNSLEEYKGDIKVIYADDLKTLLMQYLLKNDDWLY